ncbi:MAG: hypothetical protein AAGI30_01650 [Planctomycetota bacterium]
MTGSHKQGSGRLISDRYRAELEGAPTSRRLGLDDTEPNRPANGTSGVRVAVLTIAIVAAAVSTIVSWQLMRPSAPTPINTYIDADEAASLGIASLWATAVMHHAMQNGGKLPPASWSITEQFKDSRETEANVDLTWSPYADEPTTQSDFVYHPVVESYDALLALDPSQMIIVVDQAALNQGLLHAAFLDGSARAISRSEAEHLITIDQNTWLTTTLGLDPTQLPE